MGIVKKIDRELFRQAREKGWGVVRPCNPARQTNCRRTICYIGGASLWGKCFLTGNKGAQRGNYPRRKLKTVKTKNRGIHARVNI